jgi:hypothetical protein
MVCTVPLLLLYWLYRPTVLANPGPGSLQEPMVTALSLGPSLPEFPEDVGTSDQAPPAVVGEGRDEPAPAERKLKSPVATSASHRIAGHRNVRLAGSVRRLAPAYDVSAAAADPGGYTGMSWGGASAYAYAAAQNGRHR